MTEEKQQETPNKDEGIVIRAKFDDRPETVFTIALDDMTNRESIDTEEFFNKPIEILILDGWLLNSRKGLIWLTYLARRRKEPDFTFEQAVENFDSQVDDQTTVPTDASKKPGSPT